MKKYLLLFFILLFNFNWFASAEDYDQGEISYDNGFEEGGLTEGIPQNNESYNVSVQNDNGMVMQPGLVPRNGVFINNQLGIDQNTQVDAVTKREHVQSLVNNILKLNFNKNNRENITKNGGTIIDKNLKNKLFKLQKDLDEISRSLDGLSSQEKALKKGKKSIKKNKKPKKLTKRRNQYRNSSKSNRQRSFYTIKRLTTQNAVQYVPRYYSSKNNNGVSKSDSVIRYKLKNWGTGQTSTIGTQHHNKAYFSDKSRCFSGC